MILGMYPTCRFASVQTRTGVWEREVPVEDIDEPLEYTVTLMVTASGMCAQALIFSKIISRRWA